MRTTLAIDDDVLAAAKGLAAHEHKSLGAVISDLARKALSPPPEGGGMRNGIPQLKVRPGAPPVTLEMVKRLDEEIP